MIHFYLWNSGHEVISTFSSMSLECNHLTGDMTFIWGQSAVVEDQYQSIIK